MLHHRLRAASGARSASAAGFFIDDFGAPAVALSLRLLSSTYSGPCIRVRRSSDNSEQDIGFSGGSLDSSALIAFCGDSSGYVTTFYDQSGNENHALNSTASQQPLIVNAGVINKNSGFNALYPREGLGMDTGISGISQSTSLSVVNSTPTTIQGIARIFTSYSGSGPVGAEVMLDYINSSHVYRFFSGGKTVVKQTASGFAITAAWRTATDIYLSVNNLSDVSAPAPSGASTNTLKIIEEGGSAPDELATAFFELIHYNSDRSADVVAMRDAINSYYGAY